MIIKTRQQTGGGSNVELDHGREGLRDVFGKENRFSVDQAS